MQTFIQVLNLLFILTLSWWIWKRETITKMRKFYWPALAAKLSAGILVGVLYAVFYTASDTFYFFDVAVEASRNARIDFAGYLNYLFTQSDGYFLGEARALFFIKITSVFMLITYDNYWICSLYFSLFSFLAAWRLTNFIWQNIPDMGIAAATAFLFFPSCVFWASGIMKESVAMTALFYLTTIFLKIWLKQRVSMLHIVGGLIAIWICWNLKYYYIGLFLPAILSTWWSRKIMEVTQMHGRIREFAAWIFLFVLLVVGASFMHPNFSLQRVAEVLVQNHNAIFQVSNPDDVIHFQSLSASFTSILANAPWALLSGLFRPFLWEANTFLKIVVGLENLVLLAATLLAIPLIPKIRNSPYRLPILAILVYCILLCVFLAISTPNFGTLVRLRIGFLPFLVLLIASQPMITKPLAKLFNVPLPGLSH